MKNKRGFTLIELLVTILILGIISGMSIPLIRRIQANNMQRKYDMYGKSMLSSAKLYKDSYAEDLFGHHDSGCAIVSLSSLIGKGFMKDFPEKNITCIHDATNVSIFKLGKKYGYSYVLSCGTNGDIDSFGVKSQSETGRSTSCGEGDLLAELSNANISSELKKVHTERINVSSSTGIHSLDIDYAWVKLDLMAENVEGVVPSSIVDTEWKPLTYSKIPSKEKQEKIILSDTEKVSITSQEIKTPTSEPAKYALVLRVNSLKNLVNENLGIKDSIENKYKVYGIYNVGKEYILTYDSNGGSPCSPNKVSIMQDSSFSQTLKDVELCAPDKDNNTFVGWNTNADGSGTTITKDSKITADTTVYAKWQAITGAKIGFKFQLASGDNYTAKTTADNGTVYTWGKNGNIVTRKVNSGAVSDYVVYIPKGKNVSLNLPNYNSSKALNIYKDYNTADAATAWKCVSGCVNANQVFSQGAITIADTSNLFNSDTVVLKVNWRSTKVKIRYKVRTEEILNTKNGAGYKLDSNRYVLRNDSNIFHEIPYNEKIGGSGLLAPNNSKHLQITKDYYTAKEDEEWKCIGGGCTTGTKYDQSDTNLKATDFCPASTLKTGDCTVNLAVTWRKNKVYLLYHMNGGRLHKTYTHDATSVGDYVANSHKVIKFHSQDFDDRFYRSGYGLIDVWNTNYAYIIKDGKKIDHSGGWTWNCKANGKGTTYNQYYPTSKHKAYKATDLCPEQCDVKLGDCDITLYVLWK